MTLPFLWTGKGVVERSSALEKFNDWRDRKGARVLPGFLYCGYFEPRHSARVWGLRIVNALGLGA